MATADTTRHNCKSECDNCREAGISKDSVSFCYECDLHFCDVCNKLHGKIATKHKVDYEDKTIKLEERSSYVLCSKHSKEFAEYYCQEHDSVICKICKQSDHAKCSVQYISEACEGSNISQDMCDTFAQLLGLQEMTDKMKREKQLALERYRTDMDEQRNNVKTLKRRFNNMLERYDSQLESQEALFANTFSASIQACISLSEQVKQQTQSLENERDRSNKIMLFQQLINAKNMGKKFKSMLEEIRGKKISCDITIKEDKELPTLLDQLSKLVHQEVVDSEKVVEPEENTNEKLPKKKSFLNITSCSVVKETDVRLRNDGNLPYINGCCWLPDGQVILCDYHNDNIKILDKDMNIKFTAPLASPWDIDCIDESSAVITLPNAKALQFISVKPGFKINQTKDLKLTCYGVGVHGKNIFVCSNNSNPSVKGVKVLTLTGDEVSFISHLGSGAPRYVCLNTDGTRIYYTGGSGKDLFINCVTKDGYGIFTISSSELDYPRSIIHDEDGNVMVCDNNKKWVQIISSEGVCGNILLTEKNNMYTPVSMCLNKSYNVLIVASWKTSDPPTAKLTIYKLEYT